MRIESGKQLVKLIPDSSLSYYGLYIDNVLFSIGNKNIYKQKGVLINELAKIISYYKIRLKQYDSPLRFRDVVTKTKQEVLEDLEKGIYQIKIVI